MLVPLGVPVVHWQATHSAINGKAGGSSPPGDVAQAVRLGHVSRPGVSVVQSAVNQNSAVGTAWGSLLDAPLPDP